MKLLQVTIIFAIVACIVAKPNGRPGVTKRNQWSHLTRMYAGHKLVYGCDRRHTYLDDGKCWAYCGADWVGTRNKLTVCNIIYINKIIYSDTELL